MKRLNIQIHVDRLPVESVEATIERLKLLAPHATLCEGNDNGRYINVNCEVDNVAQLWTLVRHELQTNTVLAHASIVVCEGVEGWRDYLLLHHFDSGETLDDLP